MALLDTIRRIATPEGCELELRIAGPITRVRAWLYDFLIRMLAWFLLAMAVPFFGNAAMGIFMVLTFLLEWFYPILFEVYMGGQTPGKRACDLVVVHDDGRPIGWGASFIRNTVRFVDFIPLFYATGFVTSLLNADGKRLGDFAAGTLVVHADPHLRPQQAIAENEEKASEAPITPLTLEEQRAIIEYHRRAPLLTDERALELAGFPQPLVAGLRPEDARRRLLRMGNFLLGR